jgi:hypothetical protein
MWAGPKMSLDKFSNTRRGLPIPVTGGRAGGHYCSLLELDFSELEARIAALMSENPEAPPLTVQRYGEAVFVSLLRPGPKKPATMPWYRKFEKREHK